MESSNPFDLRPRTRVVFGNGSIDRLADLVKELGGARVLVVSDPGIVAAGHPAHAMRSLDAAGCAWTIFTGVEENPTTQHVDAGLAVATQFKPDVIIGLGGGSSMDCAKGINFLLTNGGRMQDYWGVGKATRPMLPLIAIPTTAGTGSEAQSFALIADPESHQKMACGDPKAAAAVAILDPELTLSQPARVTALTGIDAVSHALETWVCKKRNAVSKMYSREAWRLISTGLPRVLSEPGDIEARSDMLLGAHLAGAAIENSMLGIAHSCANPLTAHFGIVHGAAVGMMLPAVIRFNGAETASLYGEICSAGSSGGVDTLVATVESLLDQAEIPRRLSDHKVPEAELPRLAKEASQQWTVQFNPRAVTVDDLLDIYRAVL